MIFASLPLLFALASPPVVDGEDGPHVAVLVSVDDYGAPEINLNSPGQDTALLASELAGTSFTVTRAHNVDRAGFVATLLDAKREVGNGVVFFYFSGHAVQVNGENWLIPRGSALKTIDQVPLQAVSVAQVLGAFSEARVRVLVLDACRTNPFGLGTKGSTPGLARDHLDNLDGTLVSYAAAPGSVAYDGAPGSPSPFTLALVKHLKTPGLDLPNLFMEVRGDLLTATKDLPNGPQRSEEVSSLTARHRVAFVPAADVAGVKAVAANGAACSIAVLDLVPTGLSPADTVAVPRLLSEIIANEVATASGCHVLSQGDLKGMVDFEATKATCGENEASCMASLGDALGVDRILVGTVGKLGTDYVIVVRLVDNRRSVVSARGEQVVNGGAEQLRRAAKTAIGSLFAPLGGTPVVVAAPAPAQEPAPPNYLVIGGIGAGSVGLLSIVGAAALAIDADAHLGVATNTNKASAYTQGRVALGLGTVGAVALIGGVTLATLGVIE